jgi:IMP dehydrogenase
MFTLIDKIKGIIGLDSKLLGMGLTYDDVLLVPGHNKNGSRQNVSIGNTDKSGHFSLSLPIISANMDMITGADMANFMSTQGGMGALHRLMSTKANVEEFKKVKGHCFVSIGCNEKGLKRAE